MGHLIGGPYDQEHGRGGPGGWWIMQEVDVELGPHDIVRPDVVGWRRERLPAPWGQRPVRVAPDWVCEIISPSNERHDRVLKADLYAQAGVRHLWLVAPAERFLEAFELRSNVWLRIGAWDEQAVVRVAPFLEVQLEVGRLFPPRA